MSHLNLDDDEWSAVNLGPDTLGWAGPYLPVRHTNTRADVTFLMGDRVLPLDATVFSIGLLDPFSFSQSKYESAIMDVGYSKPFAVRVPIGSLDVRDEDGEIHYSGHSLDTIRIVLSKFFTAYIAEVQADLHTLETPMEVIRKYAELMHYRYPTVLLEALTWRGRALSDVPQGTQVQVKTVRGTLSTSPYSGYWNLAHVKRNAAFSSLVEWQTRISFDHTRKTPKNVFVIKAFSDEEYETGKRLFKTPELLEKYSTKIGTEVQDASFFLCQTGDPLEEWIDGEVISMEDFSKVAFELTAEIRKSLIFFDEGVVKVYG